MIDKANNRQIVQKGRRLNDFYTAEDMPAGSDAWEITEYYRQKLTSEDRLISREVISEGPLFIIIQSKYKIGKKSELKQNMIFYADNPRIDFETFVDWREKHVMLKTGFAIDILADSCRNDAQFGHIVRAMHQNTPYDAAKFETWCHKWVDVSEGDYGVALLNDCKYGLDTLDKMVSLTLLRSPTGPDESADLGQHQFTYSILPHAGDFSAETVVRQGYELNAPMTCLRADLAKSGAAALGFCEVSNPNVVVEAIKKAEESDAVVVRVYEANKSRGPASLTFSRAIKTAAECNLMEEDEKPVKAKGNSIAFEILPFEIKTFKVEFA